MVQTLAKSRVAFAVVAFFLGAGSIYFALNRQEDFGGLVERTCMIPSTERLEKNTGAEAERLFQTGRAHDITIRRNAPDTVPTELRNLKADRVLARRHYQQAAEAGHVDAMNNLAVYEQKG